MSAAARPRIAVVDYGMGNRRSVEKALERVGASAFVSRAPAELRAADGLLLPGVGAFPAAMATIRELGLDALLRERAAAGGPRVGAGVGGGVAVGRRARGCWARAWGCSCCSSAPRSTAARRAWACCAARCADCARRARSCRTS